MTAPVNWRVAAADARTTVRRPATVGAAVARTTRGEATAAIVSVACVLVRRREWKSIQGARRRLVMTEPVLALARGGLPRASVKW